MFEKMIGQEGVKKALSFYAQGHESGGFIPPLGFWGPAGTGKTHFSREFSRNIRNECGARRPLLEINCASLKNAGMFFDGAVIPFLVGNEVTVFFDEAHAIPEDLSFSLLTILNVEKGHVTKFTYNGQLIDFNLRRLTFIFATTESDRIFPPLKDRLESIEFSAYTNEELQRIFILNFPKDTAQFTPEALTLIADSSREVPRFAVKLARDLVLFCKSEGVKEFDEACFYRFLRRRGKLPNGMMQIERRILEILEEGDSTLTVIAARTGMSPTAIRRDQEKFLLRKGLIVIEGRRRITEAGRHVLQTIRAFEGAKKRQ